MQVNMFDIVFFTRKIFLLKETSMHGSDNLPFLSLYLHTSLSHNDGGKISGLKTLAQKKR